MSQSENRETNRSSDGSDAAVVTGPLEKTVALVTGASSGIGEATARRLAAEGATVALLARRRERLETLAGEIRAQGGNALVLEADVTDRRQAAAGVARVLDELGRLDTLVNNAGSMMLGPALDATIDDWDRMIALNVEGLLYVTHAALPHLVRAAADSPRGVADLVNIARRRGGWPARGAASTTSRSSGSKASRSRCAKRCSGAVSASVSSSRGSSTPSWSRTSPRTCSGPLVPSSNRSRGFGPRTSPMPWLTW